MNKTKICPSEYSLAKYHTYGIDVTARYLVKVHDREELSSSLAFAKEEKVPFVFLGRGSNCIFKEDTFPGLVIINKMTSIKIVGNTVIAGSGVNLPLLSRKTSKLHLSGLEHLVGVPGSVGGSVYMNAGVSGFEISNHILSVEALLEDGRYKMFSKEECGFSYRHSIFQRGGAIITKVIFDLIADVGAPALLQKNLQARLMTQPIAEKNSGCIFKNPPGKLSAGALIDKCGLKGLRSGGAVVSHLHANFINNDLNATSYDVLKLIHQVKDTVKNKMGVDLEYEIRLI